MSPVKYKWRFAIGTTSRVPAREGYHYLIADFDGEAFPETNSALQLFLKKDNCFWEKTPHGWHLYTNIEMTFDTLVILLHCIDADPAWIKIGEERGYFYLAHKTFLNFPWPVEYMCLNSYYGKKET